MRVEFKKKICKNLNLLLVTQVYPSGKKYIFAGIAKQFFLSFEF